MPKLNTVVENLDEVPDGLQELYTETKLDDGNTFYVLQLDEDVKRHPSVLALANAHERQKMFNNDLKTKLAEHGIQIQADKAGKLTAIEGFPEFDPDEIERLRDVEKAFNRLKEESEGDPEARKAHEAELASFKKTFEERVNKIQKKAAEDLDAASKQNSALTKRIHTMVIRDGLARLLAENGVKKETLPFVQAKLERAARVEENDDGEPIMVFETDMGPIPGNQYVPNWVQSEEAKPFIDQQVGGGALGGGGRKSSFGDANPWSAAHWNMVRQAEILKKDPGKADRMAKAAGHPKGAPGALRMDAK